MRILYLTQWFDPEPGVVKGPAFVRGLIAAGHEVTVVTGLPNYPRGKFYPGYRVRFLQQEEIDGVSIIRLPLYPSHDSSAVRRSLNFLSFFIAVLVYCLLRRARFDLVYAYHPPITVGLAAAIVGLVRRSPLVLDVQDLWPDTLAAAEIGSSAFLARPLTAVCAFVYRRARAIVVQSNGMRRMLIDRGVPPSKLSVIHNWSLTANVQNSPETPGRPGFTLVYAGNLGRAQALGTVIDAAAKLAGLNPRIAIFLYGDGVEAEQLRERAALAGLTNLHFPGRLPQREIGRIMASADALLLHLGAAPLFEITIPSKTQAYLAAGRPIVAGIAGEAADLLKASGAALVVDPQKPGALADAICAMARMPAPQREAMGARGRRYYEQTFSLERGISRTLGVIESTYRQEARSEVVAAT